MTFKLITPPGMLFTTTLLVIYGSYAVLIGSIEDSWILLAGGVAAVVATYGTAMVRPWSQYLVYVLTIGFGAKLGLSVLQATKAGYFEFQFGPQNEIMASLAPLILMCLLGFTPCTIVQRQFRREPA